MTIRKLFITMLICAMFCAPIARAQQAQDNQPQTQPGNNISQDVLIIIQQEKVRFTAQKAVAEMQLQVFDQKGEMVYDSGAITEQEINWALHDASGEAIKSGLYAYTLSIKEAGAETARVRRGHFIVDRAKDQYRDTDKLWVTSQNDNGVGTELTVARDETTTVAGLSSPSREQASTRSESERGGETERGGEAGTQKDKAKKDKKSGTAELSLSGTGVAGQIVKFISEEEIGNSEITEVDGNVGIGTTTPLSKLTLQTPTASYGLSHTDGQVNLTSWVGTGASGASGGWFGTRSNDALHFFTNDSAPHMSITQSGSVGIGVLNPSGRLHILGSPEFAGTLRLQPDPSKGTNQSHAHWGPTGDWYIRSASRAGNVILQDTGGRVAIGTNAPVSSRVTIAGQDALTLWGWQPFLTLHDTNGRQWDQHRIQSAHGDLAFFQGVPQVGELDLVGFTPTMVIKDGGDVGIGVAYPQAKLHVAGSFLRVDGAGNEQAYLGGDGFGSDVQLGSSNPNISNVALWNSATGTNMNLFVKSLTITGGADFAENFDVSVAPTASEEMSAKVEAGMVVSIDAENPGKLVLSTQAYDYQVAGIISGAGGVNPGMMMSQTGTLANGQHPVALSGRVYCRVDATHGEIKPGDLLTTSSTPGHAMKASDRNRAQGAIIGKAMTGLKSGRGLVLVLVTLQ